MEKINFELLKQMLEKDSNGLVSIYLPTWRYGSETGHSRIHLKNSLKVAEEKLVGLGYGSKEALDVLKPAAQLIDETLFWQQQDRTLALFASSDSFMYFKLPVSTEESVTVSNRYYLRPMLKFFTSDSVFNILTLSQSNAKLYTASPYRIERFDVPEIDDLVENFIPGRGLHQEATSPKGAAGGTTSFMHGYNEMSQTERNELTKHLRSIDREVSRVLKGTANPLLIYSVDYLYPMYKEVSGYPNIVTESVRGNPDGIKDLDIHSKACSVIEPKMESELERELEKFLTLRGADSKLASSEIEEIATLALQGRVEKLYVANGAQQWGYVDSDTGKVILDNEEGNGHLDLLDFAAIKTMETGGKVFILDREKMPVLKPAAAIFRS